MPHSAAPNESLAISIVSGGIPGGGATTFLCNFAGELVRRKIPVEVLSLEYRHPFASDFERAGISVHLEDERRALLEHRIEGVLKVMAETRPNVVVANLGGVAYEVLRYVPQNVLRVGVVHADHPEVYRMLGNYTAYVDLLATVSQTIKQNLEKLPGFAGVPIKCLPLGVPMPALPSPRDFQGRLRIAYVGRLAREQKRVHLFPQILRDLQASGIPFEWTLAGEGPEETWLRQALLSVTVASAERAPDSSRPKQTISFRGPVPYADVPNLLSSQDVFLLASDYEGLPLTLLEAMGNGLVPVVSDLPSGIRELVDENTGRRVAPEDVHGYAREIGWLHEHRSDMARLSANARGKVCHDYSVAAMTDRWLAAFGQARPRNEWPPQSKVEAPLNSRGRLRFTALGRFLRKIKLRLHGQ